MQVPAPVVVMAPQMFDTTELLSAGSTSIFLTNIGLIAADDVTLALPSPQVSTLLSSPIDRRLGRPKLAAAPHAS